MVKKEWFWMDQLKTKQMSNINEFMDSMIKRETNHVEYCTKRLEELDATDKSMRDFYEEQIQNSRMWLDVLYTARDSKAEQNYCYSYENTKK
tara:strand:+ start:1591 stop:1866 length:276 start_codon:yes stop_codon:yes gene_type:complete